MMGFPAPKPIGFWDTFFSSKNTAAGPVAPKLSSREHILELQNTQVFRVLFCLPQRAPFPAAKSSRSWVQNGTRWAQKVVIFDVKFLHQKPEAFLKSLVSFSKKPVPQPQNF